ARGYVVPFGHGFAGTIAATREPLEIDALESSLLLSPIIRRAGIRALYGVPLVFGDQVVGVAHMGSRSDAVFSREDKLLFRSTAARATSLIVNAQRLEAERAAQDGERAARLAAERSAAELSAVLDSIPDAVYIGDARGIERT